jgi:hypothetical protein
MVNRSLPMPSKNRQPILVGAAIVALCLLGVVLSLTEDNRVARSGIGAAIERQLR